MLIVPGIARSGLTVTMQMLNAGGYPCVGEYPAFEKYNIGDIPWEECVGKAVKVVDTHIQFPPEGRYKVIFLTRDIKQQVKSQCKFLKFIAGIDSKPSSRYVKSCPGLHFTAFFVLFSKHYTVASEFLSQRLTQNMLTYDNNDV